MAQHEKIFTAINNINNLIDGEQGNFYLIFLKIVQI